MLSALVITIKFGFVLWLAKMVFAKLLNPEDGAWISGKPFAIYILFFTAGMFVHNIWIYHALLTLTLPLMAKSRAEAAALFVVAIGAAPDLSVNVRIGSISLLAVDKWLDLSVGFAWVFVRKGRVGLPALSRYDIPFLLIFVLDVVQSRDLNLTSTLRGITNSLLTMALPYYLFVHSVGKVSDLRRVMIAVSFVGFMLAVVGIYEARLHFMAYQHLYDMLGVQGLGYKLYKMRGGILRVATVFADATTFSIFLATALMTTLVIRHSFRSTSKLAIALAVITLGIFFTSSRNAWLSVVISVLAFDLYRRRYVSLAGKAMVLGMGYAMLLLSAQFIPYIRTMMGKSGDTAGTADYRSQLLTRGIEEFRKHPIAGLDPTSIYANMADMRQGEGIVDFVNAYLYYSLTAGTYGLVALALGFLLPCYAMLKIRRHMAAQSAILQRTTAAVFAIAAAYFITSAITGFGGRGSTYYYIVLGIGSILYGWRRIPQEILAASDRPRRSFAGHGFNVMPLKPRFEPAPVVQRSAHDLVSS